MIDIEKIQENLSDEALKKLLKKVGFQDLEIEEYEDKFIMPTYCHNNVGDQTASKKLYYYKDTKLFHCYTECGCSFNVIGFLMKVLGISAGKAFSFLEDFFIFDFGLGFGGIQNSNNKVKVSFRKDDPFDKEYQLPVYPKSVLSVFEKIPIPIWEKEGIKKESCFRYGICYSQTRNKIIIPHFNIVSELVGIRGRALNLREINLGFKYMPVEIEGVLYKHPLSLNLYGLHLNAEIISKRGMAILFEGEKSVLKFDSFYGAENNISLAICGYSIQKRQMEILIDLGVKEVVLALDKPKNERKSLDFFYKKIRELDKMLSPYMAVTFIPSASAIKLEEADAPIDKGSDYFLELFNKRQRIGGF